MWDQMTRTPSPDNPRMPPGTHFKPPLHGILTMAQIYVYVYGYVWITERRHDHLNQSATSSIDSRFPLHLSDTSAVFGIFSFALLTGSNLIQLTGPDLIWLNISDLVWITIYDLIWITSSNLIQLTNFDLIWLTGSDLILLIVSDLIWIMVIYWIWLILFDSIQIMFNTFIFDSSHIIQVPFNLGFMEYYIGQGVFEIIQHWNCRIFHNYEN